MSRNIENALQVQGWMEEHDLVWLAEQAARHSQIAEVGCWHGRSTTCLADNTSGVVYAIDHWRGSEEHQPVDPEQLYNTFLKQMKPYIAAGKVMPMRICSTRAAAHFSALKQTFDMVFIDASHDYDSIRADILAWQPLVRPGGLFCGHDAGHPPIMRALEELLPTRLSNAGSMWQVLM